MRDITNEALRRMYFACRDRSGFPGKMPAGCDDDDADISIHAILQGLGLIPNNEQEIPSGDRYNLEHGTSRAAAGSMSTTPSQSAPRIVSGTARGNVSVPQHEERGTSQNSAIEQDRSTSAMLDHDHHAHFALETPMDDDDDHLADDREFNSLASNGPLVNQSLFERDMRDDGNQAVNGFLPAWSGSFTSATNSYGYEHNYAY